MSAADPQSPFLSRQADEWQVVEAFFEGQRDRVRSVYRLGESHGDPSEEPFLWVGADFLYPSGGKEYRHLICVKSQKDNDCAGCQVAVSQIRLWWDDTRDHWVKDFFIEDQFETGSFGQPADFSILHLTGSESFLAVEDAFSFKGVSTTRFYLYSRNDLLLEYVQNETNEASGVGEAFVYRFDSTFSVDPEQGIVTILRQGTRPVTGANGDPGIENFEETLRYQFRSGHLVRF